MINYLTGENMKKIGIIAEYNPFHNGHIYHLSKIKELYPDSIIILALNGYFLERGDISVLNKEDKTKLALKYGVDVVIELPTLFGTQSADQFAFGSIFLLNALGVEEIVFGSETTDIEKFYQLAKTQLDSDFSLKNTNKKDNYPTRLNSKLNVTTTILPNDILAISYIKTILKYNYNIKATAIKRTNNYHDLLSDDNIISASNIRNKKQNNQDISSYLPIDAINKWQKIDDKKLFSFLKHKILLEDNLDKIIDVTEGLDYKCGTGHGVSYMLGVHEGPIGLRYYTRPNIKDDYPLEVGNIVTDEPGVYKDYKYGIRIENELLVVKDKSTDQGEFLTFETVTYCPYDKRGIDVDMLTDEELTFLNNYHKLVYDKLSPQIRDQELLAFLKDCTSPLEK